MARRNFIRGIELAGAVASIVTLIVSKGLRDFLGRDVTLPLRAVIAAIVAPAVVCGAIAGRRRALVESCSALTHPMINQAPKLVASGNKESVDALGATVIKAPRGTFATWVYLDTMGNGIRRLINNRYILACTTTPYRPYKNVVSLSHGPREKYDPPEDPSWRIWLANEAGEGKVWTCPDGPEFPPGWHLFVLRWDHSSPRLELLVDNRVVRVAEGYQHYWPKDYPDRLLVGCWPSYAPVHYADTYLWRTQLFPDCASANWVAKELAQRAPADPPY
jgi:hypothetical protein